ncbi:hypothetical protein FD754_010912 [Muntiacus muntjak]|uniref:Nucleolar protein 5A n=1 Tax=Muntiacus muntjak TaxID=9888 RepID=A0A5N3X2W1_MUNMU|nr:hypothetical protein FD754_010912 [Muntiacus muntjak]
MVYVCLFLKQYLFSSLLINKSCRPGRPRSPPSFISFSHFQKFCFSSSNLSDLNALLFQLLPPLTQIKKETTAVNPCFDSCSTLNKLKKNFTLLNKRERVKVSRVILLKDLSLKMLPINSSKAWLPVYTMLSHFMANHKVIQHADLIGEFLDLTYHRRDYEEHGENLKVHSKKIFPQLVSDTDEVANQFAPLSTDAGLGHVTYFSRALKTRGNTPKYRLIFHSTFIGRAAAKNKGRISQYLANKCSIASRIDCFSENLDVMKEAMVQLEKQEKKCLRKEKKRLAAIALETNERPKKKKKQKPQEKKKSFSKEVLVSSDLEETAGTGSLPKRKKSFPKEEPVTDPNESENKRVPKKKEKLSSKEEPLSSGPEKAAASKSSSSKKKKRL